MPRAVKKEQPLHFDPVVWGIAGAYVIGILMAGTISVMTSVPDLRSSINYNKTKASFDESAKSVVGSRETLAVQEDHSVLVNGSFEMPIIRSQSKLITDGSSQLGWHVTWTNPGNPKQLSLTRQPAVELIAGFLGWQASEGAQFARLDTADLGARSARTQSLVTLSQTIRARPGLYNLTFDFAAQPKTGKQDNQVDIRWNGKVVGSVSADGSKDTKPVWQDYTYPVQVTGNDTLEVVGRGDENNKGALVDNFALSPVTR